MLESQDKAARPGRPRSEVAASHEAILDAVYELLQELPARDLTMEAVAKRAGVGKPTLYKWWPSKAALILAMFQERLSGRPEKPAAGNAERAIRNKIHRLIQELNGLFGKVVADLIVEGQSEPAILKELYERHMRHRRAATAADVERGKASGEFRADVDAELLADALVGPLYFRLLVRFAPITEQFGDALIDQALSGVRLTPPRG